MNIARVQYEQEVFYAVLEDGMLRRIEGDIFGQYRVKPEAVYSLDEVSLLAPVSPPNVIAIGLNYRRHAEESGMELPRRPVVFLKATTAVVGPDTPILLPKMAPKEVDYEAELAVVIGRKASGIAPENIADYILGYTCSNDVSARDCQQRLDSQWARAKSFDTFCPLGPWICTELDPQSLGIVSKLNGETMQESNTADMIFSVYDLVSYCSMNMTLLPGTVIMTGTPEGVGFARKPPRFLAHGDLVEIEIEGIGVLRNPVRQG